MKLVKRFFTLLAPSLFLRDTATVHYAFSFLFILAAAIGMAAVLGGTSSYISLTSSEQFVTAGQEFTIAVSAYAHTPVNALDIDIAFSPDMVEVLSVDKGESVITLWTSEPTVENGVVSLSGGTYRKGFVGKHHIATINVRAKTTGQANFVTKSLELLAGDGKATPVSTSLSEGVLSLRIVEDAPATLDEEAVFVIVTDIDGDGNVGLDDISSFMAAWASRKQLYDFNNDGQMSFKDFSIILATYFKS